MSPDAPELDVERMQAAPGRSVLLEGIRDGQPFAVQVTPREERVGEKAVGRIRAQVDLSSATVMISSGPTEAVGRAAGEGQITSYPATDADQQRFDAIYLRDGERNAAALERFGIDGQSVFQLTRASLPARDVVACGDSV